MKRYLVLGILLLFPLSLLAANVSTWNGVADSTISTLNGVASASIGTLNGATWNDGDGGGPPAYVGGNKNTGATPVVVTYSSTSGNLLVAGCESFSTTATFAISDNQSQSWTAETRLVGTSHATQMFYMQNSVAITSVTCTVTNPGGTNRAVVAEFSGIATSNPKRQGAQATGTSNAPASGNFTVTDGDLIIGYAFANTLVVGSGFTMPAELTDGWEGMEYKINSGTTANATYTSAWNEWSVTGIAFIPQ